MILPVKINNHLYLSGFQELHFLLIVRFLEEKNPKNYLLVTSLISFSAHFCDLHPTGIALIYFHMLHPIRKFLVFIFCDLSIVFRIVVLVVSQTMTP